MKLSTRKVLGIEVGVVLGWLILMLVVPNTIWREVLEIGVLGGGILVSLWLLGWAKPQAREGKLATLVIVLLALLFQVVTFVFFGLKLGYVYNIYGWGWGSIFTIFLPMAAMIVLMEILRGQMVAKAHENRVMMVVTVAVFGLLMTMWSWLAYDFTMAKDLFDVIVTVALPCLLTSVMLTFVAYWYDYRAGIAYRLVMEMPTVLLPILPNVDNYIVIMFQIGLVLIMLVILSRMHESVEAKRTGVKRVQGDSERKWKRYAAYAGVGIITLVMIGYVALMSGLFKYHFLAVGSGSMEPSIARGDMVIVKKSAEYGEMNEGEILVFRHGDAVVMHRINEITKSGENFRFRTKGDANQDADNWIVEQGDVIGVVKGKIMAFGYPTIWLNEIFNGGKM